MRILLISNSTVHGRGYLDHAENEIRNFLGAARNVLFFPFAVYDRDGYAAKASTRFAEMGYTMTSAHSSARVTSDCSSATSSPTTAFMRTSMPIVLRCSVTKSELVSTRNGVSISLPTARMQAFTAA